MSEVRDDPASYHICSFINQEYNIHGDYSAYR